jgi:hypothetical protein
MGKYLIIAAQNGAKLINSQCNNMRVDCMNISKFTNLVYMALVVLGFSSIIASAATGVTGVTSQICGIVNTIRTVVGVLAIALFIAGGAIYAVAHLLPAAGNVRAGAQGWSMAMIVGGVIGLVLVIIAPFIVNMVVGFSGTAGAGGGSITLPASC